MVQRKMMARRIFYVFMIYPFISLFFVGIQFFFPKIILTGVASFTSVLFAYITVQSYMIEVDYRTGLMRESKLRRRISMQRKGGVLFVMTIERINIIQSSLDTKEFDHLFLQLGTILLSYFPRDAYILSINRFAAVGKSVEEVKQKDAAQINAVIKFVGDNGFDDAFRALHRFRNLLVIPRIPVKDGGKIVPRQNTFCLDIHDPYGTDGAEVLRERQSCPRRLQHVFRRYAPFTIHHRVCTAVRSDQYES